MAENEHRAGEEPRNPNVRHEFGDVNAVSITKFGIAMSLLILVFLFSIAGLFRYFATRAAEAQAPAPAVGAIIQVHPIEPRLQPHPSQDLKKMRADEDQIINQYAWIDPDKGVVRIPVDRAMDLVLERGLPPVPAQTKTPAPVAAGNTK